MKVAFVFSFFSALVVASPLNYCSRSELQFFNTYASTIINPARWNATSSASVVFGYRPVYQEDSVIRQENYLVKFVFHAKNDQNLILRGDIHVVESPTPENKRALCWKTALYFTYDLTRPESFPEVTTLDGVAVPLIGDNLNFKSCELLSRTFDPQGSESRHEIIAGTTNEGDKYTFWMTYAKPDSILKVFEGQRTRNAQTVFFETVGLKN